MISSLMVKNSFWRFSKNIYENISLNSGISWGLAAPRPPHGFPRVLGHGGDQQKQFVENMIFIKIFNSGVNEFIYFQTYIIFCLMKFKI